MPFSNAVNKMEKIFEGIYRLKQPPFGPPSWEVSNVYFVGGDEIVLIDSGYPTPESIECTLGAWKKLGSPPIKAMLITHAHLDHMGGAIDIQKEIGAPIWAHRDEGEHMTQMLPQASIDVEIEEGSTIDAGGITLKAVHLPGHTPGHLGYFMENERFMFTGDQVVGTGYAVIVPPHGHMGQYMASLRQLREMDIKMILPGHGPPVKDAPAKIEEYIIHRTLREIQILKTLGKDERSVEDMAGEIYADIDVVLRRAGQMQIIAHMEKMEKEGLVKNVSRDEKNPMYKRSVKNLPF